MQGALARVQHLPRRWVAQPRIWLQQASVLLAAQLCAGLLLWMLLVIAQTARLPPELERGLLVEVLIHLHLDGAASAPSLATATRPDAELALRIQRELGAQASVGLGSLARQEVEIAGSVQSLAVARIDTAMAALLGIAVDGALPLLRPTAGAQSRLGLTETALLRVGTEHHVWDGRGLALAQWFPASTRQPVDLWLIDAQPPADARDLLLLPAAGVGVEDLRLALKAIEAADWQLEAPLANERRLLRQREWLLLAVAAFALLLCGLGLLQAELQRAQWMRPALAVKRMHGAGSGSLLADHLVESLILVLIAGLVALPLLLALQQVLAAQLLGALAQRHEPSAELGRWFLVLVLTALASVPGALVAACEGRRRGAAREGWSPVAGLLRMGLLALGMALALALLALAHAALSSLWQANRADLGYDPKRLVLAELALPDGLGLPARLAEAARLLELARGAQAVEDVAISSSAPWDARPPAYLQGSSEDVRVHQAISSNYFALIGGGLLEGPGFTSLLGDPDSQESIPSRHAQQRSAAHPLLFLAVQMRALLAGLYSAMARPLAVRHALGAPQRALWSAGLKPALWIAVIGLASGLMLALSLGRMLRASSELAPAIAWQDLTLAAMVCLALLAWSTLASARRHIRGADFARTLQG